MPGIATPSIVLLGLYSRGAAAGAAGSARAVVEAAGMAMPIMVLLSALPIACGDDPGAGATAGADREAGGAGLTLGGPGAVLSVGAGGAPGGRPNPIIVLFGS